LNFEIYTSKDKSYFALINVNFNGSSNSLKGAKSLSFVFYEFQGKIEMQNVKISSFYT